MKEQAKGPGLGDPCWGAKLFRVVVRDPAEGHLEGFILAIGIPHGTWAVGWSIGTLDDQYELSDHWFTRRACQDEFLGLLQTAAQNNREPGMDCPGATVRWGTVRSLSGEVALAFAEGLWELWKRVADEWGAAQAASVQ